jgi:hypothetical protein
MYRTVADAALIEAAQRIAPLASARAAVLTAFENLLALKLDRRLGTIGPVHVARC